MAILAEGPNEQVPAGEPVDLQIKRSVPADRGRDAEGEKLRREGLERLPKAAALHHSRGLLPVRQSNSPA